MQDQENCSCPISSCRDHISIKVVKQQRQHCQLRNCARKCTKPLALESKVLLSMLVPSVMSLSLAGFRPRRDPGV